MVLVHLHGAPPPGLSRFLIQLFSRSLLSFFFCLLASAHIPVANAQGSVSGGLSVLDSPGPNAYGNFPFMRSPWPMNVLTRFYQILSVLAAGRNVPVAIDVRASILSRMPLPPILRNR